MHLSRKPSSGITIGAWLFAFLIAAVGICLLILQKNDPDNTALSFGISLCGIAILALVAYLVLKGNKKPSKASNDSLIPDDRFPASSAPLYHADFDVKCRILLEASYEGYTILYRRVKTTNELVINRNVYAVKKALIEFDHALIATLDDHRFEAGLKDGDTSYLAIDGRIIAEKTRIF